ncbi:MAG: endonuclease III [Deltaproteobacteria bacterium]|jgi:endonuclease-3|nr:endonuclease III [Deltaproteobacteria bacterium]
MRDQDTHKVIQILKNEVQQWQMPVVGHYSQSPFTILISCLLSLRTQDKTTGEASARLFRLAQTPRAMLKLPTSVIEKTIFPVGFYKTKAKNIKKICQILLSRDEGRVPDDIDELLKLPGVGRKTANLVVTMGYNRPGICVDTHVHRITNRWGYVRTKTPQKTEMALRDKLPRRYWIIINELLVAFGQNICKPISPFCSQCKIHRYCDRVGVSISR